MPGCHRFDIESRYLFTPSVKSSGAFDAFDMVSQVWNRDHHKRTEFRTLLDRQNVRSADSYQPGQNELMTFY